MRVVVVVVVLRATATAAGRRHAPAAQAGRQAERALAMLQHGAATGRLLIGEALCHERLRVWAALGAARDPHGG